MAVGKLRMKPVPGEVDAEPPRKRRRRSRSPSDDALRPAPSFVDGDEDESRSVPKPRRLAVDDDGSFREKLFDAMAEDEPLDSLEAEYGFTVPSRWRYGTGSTYAHAGMARSGLEAMEEEEYAEYMRRNMWRRTHRQEVMAMEERDKETRRKERELKESKRRRKEEEREHQRRVEEKAKRRAEHERRSHRDAYSTRWTALNGDAGASTLRFSDIPWPVYPPTDGSNSFTADAISAFLLDQVPATAASSRPLSELSSTIRDVLRAAIRSYHPDRFQRHVLRLREGSGERERAVEWGLKVSQVLNELLEREKGGP